MNAGIMSLFVPSFMALLGLLLEEEAAAAEELEWNEGGSNADGSPWWCDAEDAEDDEEPKPVE